MNLINVSYNLSIVLQIIRDMHLQYVSKVELVKIRREDMKEKLYVIFILITFLSAIGCASTNESKVEKRFYRKTRDIFSIDKKR